MDRESVNRVVRKLHEDIWRCRREIWLEDIPCDPVELLDLQEAARLLGYEYEVWSEIPPWPPGRQSGIGGMVDPNQKLILVSQKWGSEYMRFTGAHELGHVLLHEPTKQLREAPMDGSKPALNQTEREANWFAAEFLMPPKLMRTRFAKAFEEPPLTVDETVAFHLDGSDPEEMIRSEPERLIRESALATCRKDFNQQHIVPLHEQFKVSVKAMTIRIRELGLVRT